ncbi:four helix bundle protein [Autumnicola psychrophila]|uniref:Four helix bundle protein n=1 Tax=Autumnicola psychrophila TaxID=3075592 RepID=A0ABU3DV58_9FLAO|nr:four helix bundle protein [Zunongwangia sp. F225]MDT0687565.1 four helix bundle protein [Zunongwangia sp. F225]
MKRHNFKNLKIWQESIVLVQETYNVVKTFPDSEKFNLVSQLTRCAVSIPSNIAEGTSKSTNKHFRTYLEASLGSSFEWETQIIIAYKEQYITKEKFEKLEEKVQQIQRMIFKFIDTLS